MLNDRGSKDDCLKELFFYKTMTSPHMEVLVKSLLQTFCIMKVPSARALKSLYFSQVSLNMRFFRSNDSVLYIYHSYSGFVLSYLTTPEF